MHITVASVATMLGFVIINLEVVLKGRKIEYDEFFGRGLLSADEFVMCGKHD